MTPEQNKACDLLTEAIQACCHAFGSLDEDEIVMEYIITGYGTSLELADRRSVRSFQLFKDDGHIGNLFVYEGLLRHGLRLITQEDN